MKNGKRHKPHKLKDTQKRCVVSNKKIINKDVIIVDFAVDYVKKMGYTVISPRVERTMKTLTVLMFIFGVVFTII